MEWRRTRAGCGPWYGHVESDIEAFLESIALVVALRPGMLLSSRKGVISDDIQGRLRAFAGVIDERDRCILELLDRPRTIVGLIEASPIYGGRAYAPGVLDYWEGQMIRKRRAPRAAGASPEDRARAGRPPWAGARRRSRGAAAGSSRNI